MILYGNEVSGLDRAVKRIAQAPSTLPSSCSIQRRCLAGADFRRRDKMVHALDAKTGKTVGGNSPPAPASNPLRPSSGRVYIGPTTGFLFYVLDAAKGTKLEFEAGSPVSSSPAIGA